MTGYVPLNERPHGGHSRLLELALATRPKDVLDAGCSSRLPRAAAFGGGCPRRRARARPGAASSRASGAPTCSSATSSRWTAFEPGSFDVVLCGDLIEHLRDPGPPSHGCVRSSARRDGSSSRPRTSRTGRCGSRCSPGRWRYTERGILDRTHTHLFTRATLVETVEGAGYRVVELDHTAPVPRARDAAVERVAHAVAGVRPSLFAYQFLLVAAPP